MTSTWTAPPRVQALNAYLRDEQLAPVLGDERVQMVLEGDRPCPRYAVITSTPPSPGMQRCCGLAFTRSRSECAAVIDTYEAMTPPWTPSVVLDLDTGSRYQRDRAGTLAAI